MSGIIGTAKRLGFFKVFTSAVDAAGLEEPLDHRGPFTLLAPTDQAFAKMPPGSVERMMKNPDELRHVIAQHLIPGKATIEDLPARRKVKNALGDDLRVYSGPDGTHVDEARVVEADVEADNGMIHAIDTVLLPKAA